MAVKVQINAGHVTFVVGLYEKNWSVFQKLHETLILVFSTYLASLRFLYNVYLCL